MTNVCPADGLAYTDHPPADPPPEKYLRTREAIAQAVAQVLYWPGITTAHRLAIARARRERQAVGL